MTFLTSMGLYLLFILIFEPEMWSIRWWLCIIAAIILGTAAGSAVAELRRGGDEE